MKTLNNKSRKLIATLLTCALLTPMQTISAAQNGSGFESENTNLGTTAVEKVMAGLSDYSGHWAEKDFQT